MPAYKVIIFDLDGTLVNAYKAVYNSINHAMTTSGFPRVSAHVVKRSVGWGDRHLIEGFVGKEKAPAVLKIYRRHHQEALKTGVTFLPGAKNLLTRLKKEGYLLAIASNRPTRFTKSILKILKIEDRFDHVLCGDKSRRPKPHPDMLWEILQKQGLSRGDALFVGDMTIDAQTGRAAKVETVVVLTGSSTRREIKVFKPSKIITKISHLIPIITKRKDSK
jgi:phosphoglycolate phosphatase